MNQDILDIISAVSSEKQMDPEIVFSALEESLAAATVRKIGDETDVKIDIDRKTGDYKTFRRWTVVRELEEGEDPEEVEDAFFISDQRHYTLEQARECEKDPKAELGKTYLRQIDNIEYGRISAQSARQVMYTKLREAERIRAAAEYQNRLGELVNGVVKRVARNRDKLFVELDSLAEAVLSRWHQLEQDDFHLNSMVHAVLSDIEQTARGPQLVLSRTDPAMVTGLLRREVPEVAEQVVEIKGIAREPGGCTKIAVASRDARIDPVGACVGIGGVRVKQIMQELQGERVDIFAWDDDLVKLAINAMAPAQPLRVLADERKQMLSFVVPQSQLARAIGRNGQNVRLASKLTGWAISVLSEEEAVEQQQQQQQEDRSELSKQLDLPEALTKALLDANLGSLEDIAIAETADLESLEGFDAKLAEHVIAKAGDLMFSEAVLAGTEDSGPLDMELLQLEGMDPDLAYSLSQAGITTRKMLAEASIDEVLEKVPGLDEDYLGKLILAARADLLKAVADSTAEQDKAD